MEDLTMVWSWPAALFAVLSGIAFGGVIIAHVTLVPRWRTANRPAAYGWLVGLVAAWGGLAFYVSQVGAALLQGDNLWLRILSRYGMWLVFSFGLGLGVYLGVRWRVRERGDRT